MRAAGTGSDAGIVVALGASAGGLDALKAFFGAMPARQDLAFVVVTHLSPDRDSMLVELLGRICAMPTREAVDGERITPGTVYVIRPIA